MDLINSMFGPHIDWKQVVLTAMTPLFLIAFAIEWQVMRGRGQRAPFNGQEIVANLMLGGAYQIFEVIAHALITAAAVAWFWQHRLIDELPVNGWTILPPCARNSSISGTSACGRSSLRRNTSRVSSTKRVGLLNPDS